MLEEINLNSINHYFYVMDKIMLVPVGEELAPIYEGFKHVKEVSKVFLIASNKTRENALKIKQDLDKIHDFELIIVLADTLDEIITSILEKISNFNNLELVSNLTGGTKIMSIACYILTMLLEGTAFYIFNNNNKMVYVEIPLLKIELKDMLKEKGTKFKVLSLIAENKEISLKELSEKLGLKSSSIHNHLFSLKKKNLINIEKNSKLFFTRKMRLSLTKTGKIVYTLMNKSYGGLN